MTIPVRIPLNREDAAEEALSRLQEGCDLCGAHPVRTEFDGDQMCQSCADKWVRGQAPDEDEIAELNHSLRNAGIYRGAMIEARLTDAELLGHSKDQRRFRRNGL